LGEKFKQIALQQIADRTSISSFLDPLDEAKNFKIRVGKKNNLKF